MSTRISSLPLQQLLTDVVGQLGREDRKRFLEFVHDLKEKRDAGEIPSLSEALLRGGDAVVGAEVWRRACERQGGAEVWHRARSQAGRAARDAAFVQRGDVLTVVSSDVWSAVFSLTDMQTYCAIARTCTTFSELAHHGSKTFFRNALAHVSPAALIQLSAYPAPVTATRYCALYRRFDALNCNTIGNPPAYTPARNFDDFVFTVEIGDGREVLHACTATVHTHRDPDVHSTPARGRASRPGGGRRCSTRGRGPCGSRRKRARPAPRAARPCRASRRRA